MALLSKALSAIRPPKDIPRSNRSTSSLLFAKPAWLLTGGNAIDRTCSDCRGHVYPIGAIDAHRQQVFLWGQGSRRAAHDPLADVADGGGQG